MHIGKTFRSGDKVPATKVITFEGEARSGKGTSVVSVRDRLLAEGRSVVAIDQGLKFRALAKLGIDRGVALDEQSQVTAFLQASDTQPAMLELLQSVSKMSQADVTDILYTSFVASGSALVGQNALSHDIVIALLLAEVEQAAAAGTDTVLIDGRCMEKYGKQIAERRIAQYVVGFYFRCDTAIAARRTSGIFVDMDSMTTEDKLRLLSTITKISDRNRQDVLRDVDAMFEPAGAYPLDTAHFMITNDDFVQQATLDALYAGMVSVNTSYTRSVAEMVDPVVALATHSLNLHDRELERFAHDPRLWTAGYQEFKDPRRTVSSL